MNAREGPELHTISVYRCGGCKYHEVHPTMISYGQPTDFIRVCSHPKSLELADDVREWGMGVKVAEIGEPTHYNNSPSWCPFIQKEGEP